MISGGSSLCMSSFVTRRPSRSNQLSRRSALAVMVVAVRDRVINVREPPVRSQALGCLARPNKRRRDARPRSHRRRGRRPTSHPLSDVLLTLFHDGGRIPCHIPYVLRCLHEDIVLTSSCPGSEPMSLVQLIVPTEVAHDAISELGKLGNMQFKDVSEHIFLV